MQWSNCYCQKLSLLYKSDIIQSWTVKKNSIKNNMTIMNPPCCWPPQIPTSLLKAQSGRLMVTTTLLHQLPRYPSRISHVNTNSPNMNINSSNMNTVSLNKYVSRELTPPELNWQVSGLQLVPHGFKARQGVYQWQVIRIWYYLWVHRSQGHVLLKWLIYLITTAKLPSM